MSNASHNSSASISFSLMRCRSYVIGQSIQVQLAMGVTSLLIFRLELASARIGLIDFRARFSSCAKVTEFSTQPLHVEQVRPSSLARCCVIFSFSMAVQATDTPSFLHLRHITTLELPAARVLSPQMAQISLPK